jgi:hypothetical protein
VQEPQNPVHEYLSEEHLAGGVSQDASLEFKISRKRFRTETMPKKKAVLHSFAESFVFTDEGVQEAAQIGFSLLGKQSELRSREDICEQMAYNLGKVDHCGFNQGRRCSDTGACYKDGIL